MIEAGELRKALDHLHAGGVVAVATETFFGLCADARLSAAVEAVFALKERRETSPSALLIPDEQSWDSLVKDVPPIARRLAARFWPGPLTIALPAAEGIHPLLKYRGKTAVRIPGASMALELVRAFGSPLTATSANPSGSPSPLSDEDVSAYFAGRSGIMTIRGKAPGGMPSTVIEIGDDAWKMVRAGAVPACVIDEALAEAAA